MAWTNTKTWYTGDIVTESDLNAYLRDNLDYLKDLLDSGNIPAGLDANKPTSPSVGDTYYATDTGYIYICLNAGTWTAYMKTVQDRQNVGYIPNGPDASKPSSPDVGSTYYATDTEREYAAFSAGTWTWLGGGRRYGIAKYSGEFTTTSTTYVDVLSLSATTESGLIIAGAMVPRVLHESAAHSVSLKLVVGSEEDVFFNAYGNQVTATHVRLFDLGASGTYDVKLRCASSSATYAAKLNVDGIYAGPIVLWYMEIPK